MPNQKEQDYETLGSGSGKSSKSGYSGNRDDFPSMFVDLIRKVNWKIGFFLFIISILIFSDLFIDNILTGCSDAVEGDLPTTKGTLIQISTLVMSYLTVDVLVQAEIL